ncbi:MAG TPA: peptide ABC transporter substrate-binding protein [Vicinamibacterales bacterium]|nr:peptide ABC transporter substrate-binding protein [Vicinamibacterales bacterium]
MRKFVPATAAAFALAVLAGAFPASGAQSARHGGTVTVGLYQEPDNLNPYLAVQTASRLVRELVLEGLVETGPGNAYRPELAQAVPTVANGGISKDGRRVTYKLRPGITWSDGHPLTSADVKFTWQAIMNPSNRVNSQTGYDQIRSIATPDRYTVVVRFKKLYAPALSLFSVGDAILPAHALRGQAFGGASFNRKPEGTGPFVLTQWRSGDSIVLDRNPRFRERGRPYLDRIVFKIIPSREVGIAQIRNGEIDVLWDLIETQIPLFQQMRGVTLQSTPSSNVEYLGLNLSAKGTADPNQPHPVLGDRRVREAIAAAINRAPIVNQLLYGKTTIATSPIGLGWAAPKGLSFPAYNPARARQLLEQAGWTGSGIREKNGQRLSLEITTPTGSQLREQSQQILQQQLRAVGIELTINNVPAATLFGNWQENGKLKRGDFDIVMDTWGADFDPDGFLSTLFTSDQIPTAANNGEGWNFFRLRDARLDQAIASGRSTLDLDVRKGYYRQAVQRILNALVYLPLYNRAQLNAFRDRVVGERPNSWDEFTWNAKDWYLKR